MAITLTNVTGHGGIVGPTGLSQAVYDITLDNSYPTSGYSMAPAVSGYSSIVAITVHGLFRNGTNAVIGHFDAGTNKLFMFWGNAGTASVLPEVTNATSLASYVGRVTILGVKA